MNISTEPTNLPHLAIELFEMRQQIAKQQRELVARWALLDAHQQKLTRDNQRFTSQRRPGFGLILTLVFLIGLGGLFWSSSPVQAHFEVRTNPLTWEVNQLPLPEPVQSLKPVLVSSGPSATLPKFCAGCDHSNTSYPVGYDLQDAYLVGSNYTGTGLGGVNMMFANLTDALLVGANLTNARLDFANLYLATFDNANLTHTNISGANINYLSLSNADLTNAYMYGATGTPTSINNVIWNNTTCPDGSNSNNHLETCEGHWIP